MSTRSAKIQPDAAAQLLHRIKVAHGPQQWRAEAARLHAPFQSTHDAASFVTA